MLRCMMEAFEYFDGFPKAALTDRRKRVFLDMDGKTPIWNPRFADFMAALGVSPRVCRPFKPQTKGKVERSVGVIKHGFWPGVRFTDSDDLTGQAKRWCDRLNRDPCIAPPAKDPLICGWKRIWPLCPKRLPGNALAQRNGIRQLGWLYLVRWSLLWLTSGSTGSRFRRAGARTAARTAQLSSRPTACHAREAPALPRHCAAS